MRRSILLSGFRPFGGAACNPSQALVEWVGRSPATPGEPTVTTVVLDVEYDRAWAQLRRAVERSDPAAVVALGVSARATAFVLERIALNLDDSPLPDEAGVVRRGTPIVEDGPLAVGTRLPLDRLAAAVELAGVPVELSNHAGTYVCNHLLYRALRSLPSTLPVGFLHVPDLAREDGRDESSLTEHAARQGLKALVAELASSLPTADRG